jgi:hypothetical protein
MKDIAIMMMVMGLFIQGLENHHLRDTVTAVATRYGFLLERTVKGKPVLDMVKPGTLGILPLKEKVIICGEFTDQLPSLAQRQP